ncbi:uracil-DNA glycosylase [Arthrobacter sp. JSM 101049]|uniref:uracil-DNA glycosylase n=1 Tax=Arthrobacter sp. JSM 101049 TaxID=929097 RepID=UPI003562A929
MENDAQATWPMAPDWARALEPVLPRLQAVEAELDRRRADGELVLPAAEHVLRAFHRPMSEVRVLILGQDPYPTPGHSIGLAFAVDAAVRPLPRSLANMFAEYVADTGYPFPASGDLAPWADQGVLLLNPVLTVGAGDTGSHGKLGWQEITTAALTALAGRGTPLVSILWGRHAQRFEPLLGTTPVITSPHPSPLSARRGFFGSRPFTRANELLEAQGGEPVDWRLPAAEAAPSVGAAGAVRPPGGPAPEGPGDAPLPGL